MQAHTTLYFSNHHKGLSKKPFFNNMRSKFSLSLTFTYVNSVCDKFPANCVYIFYLFLKFLCRFFTFTLHADCKYAMIN